MTRLSTVETVLAGLACVAYLYRASSLRRAGQAPPAARVLCFCLGIAVAIAASIAFEGPGRRLVYLLTIQQLLLSDLAALLLLLGLTQAILAPLRKAPLLSLLQRASHPAIALPLWTGNMLLWHFRAPCEFALNHHSAMLLQHLLLLGLGVAVWAALLSGWADSRGRPCGPRERVLREQPESFTEPNSRRRRLRPGRWAAYALCWRLLGVALGAAGIWSSAVFYPHYLQTDAAYSLSPLADQGIGAAIMLAESAIVAICLLAWLYVRLDHAPSGLDAEVDADAGERPGAVAAGEPGIWG